MTNKLNHAEQLHDIEKTKTKFEAKLKEVRKKPSGTVLIKIKENTTYDDTDLYGPKEKGIEFTRSLLIEYLEKEIKDLEKRANEIIEALYNSI